MRLFISYRRADTQNTARAMKEFLDGTPRVQEVFLDFDEIPAGKDFVDAINAAIRKSDAAVVLMGEGWVGPQADGTRRIDAPADFVRLEVAAMLAGGHKVVPVLVDRAGMPPENQLPEDLKPLSRLNALTLRTSHFKSDMVDLLNAVAETPGKGLNYWRRPPLNLMGIGLRLVLGAALAAIILFGGLAWFGASAAANGDCAALNCLVAEHVGGLTATEISEMPARSVQVKFGGLAAALVAGWILLGALAPFISRALRR
jgi:hypothetical protein